MTETLLERFGRRLRVAMIGGGIGSYIGETHAIALRADGLWDLVAGVFSRNPETNAATARSWLVPPDRTYADHRALIAGESARADRVDAVIVATRPSSHAEIACDLLAAGFHVISEKPLTDTGAAAGRVAAAVAESGRRLLLTHCYSGYPMVRQAREMVARGDLGRITLVESRFAGGMYAASTPPGSWRVDGTEGGVTALIADLGTHALHLAEFVAGRRITTVRADLARIDPAHAAFDNAYLTLGFDGGARGRCWSTSQAAGATHGLAVTVYGDRGSLAWDHDTPETLWWRADGEADRLLTEAGPGASPAALAAARFTAGHPDGYALAFANLYRDFAFALLAEELGDDPAPYLADLPDVDDGVRTLAVVEAAVRSDEAGREVVVDA
ncbi:Gfo/Idh/MocA family protein [Tsukamurella sp. PLM1]|uniref:Gfo/Idh/MocA family protein n=1 Tax=Tsukamurella sp. PLM1 TaxID=2929795 RepID=UPI002069FEE7|nr:Gfo/Idh/MocA family oxidoreductase [Tsukamurella sp. PLM1]BDH58371.1 oxidoreductase [Tsukamurella sp. PLM1]